jgi:hypothetical protein
METGSNQQMRGAAEPRRRIRRKYLIDPATQLRFGFILFTIVACAAASVVGFRVLGSQLSADADPLTINDPAASGRLAYWVNAAYFVFTCIAVLILGIRFTHRFVGPGLVIERALNKMCDGDFSARLELRRRDKLKNVAEAAARLARKLRVEKGRLDRFVLELEEAVKRGDLEAVREKSALFRSQVETGAPSADTIRPPVATAPSPS